MKTIVMAYFGDGLWVIGELDGSKLLNPFTFAQGKNEIRISPLPGSPDTMGIADSRFWYVVKEETVLNLYFESTTGIKLPDTKVVLS